jgi:ketosteroid isomerase-like protein
VDPDLEARVRAGYAAWFGGDLEGALASFHPDATYVNPPGAIEGGTRHGHEGVAAAWRRLHEQFDFDRAHVDEVVTVDDETLIVTLSVDGRGRVSGAPIQGRMWHVLRVRDDLIASVEWYPRRDQALQAADLSSPR